MKPWHQVDHYSFRWPTLTSDIAQQRMLTLSESLMELTPRERVEKLDKWIPALRDVRAAEKAGIGVADHHLVVTALLQWREDNRERIAA